MVARQLRNRGLADERVLWAMTEVPREAFGESGALTLPLGPDERFTTGNATL